MDDIETGKLHSSSHSNHSMNSGHCKLRRKRSKDSQNWSERSKQSHHHHHGEHHNRHHSKKYDHYRNHHRSKSHDRSENLQHSSHSKKHYHSNKNHHRSKSHDRSENLQHSSHSKKHHRSNKKHLRSKSHDRSESHDRSKNPVRSKSHDNLKSHDYSKGHHHLKNHNYSGRSRNPKPSKSATRSKSPKRAIDELRKEKRRIEEMMFRGTKKIGMKIGGSKLELGGPFDNHSSLGNSHGTFDTLECFEIAKEQKQFTKEEQIRDLDEALALYGFAEIAARRIQAVFRERQQKRELLKELEDTEDESDELKTGDDNDDASTKDKSNTITIVLLALFFIVMTGPKLALTCWNGIKKCFGGNDAGGEEGMANVTVPHGGEGAVGGTGPAPTGGEGGAAGGAQAGAQGAMATQAASSAASGAASGVASGAAAGAAATSAAAAAGAAAAGAGITQVAAVVVVSTAAIAATTAAVVNPTPEPILSVCGLATPDIRSGRMVMLFEGVPRPFDERESGLVSNLVLEAYNEITFGTNVVVMGCLDPLAREMRSVSIVNQTLSILTDRLVSTMLEVVFEAQVSCDRCSETNPLFSEDQLDSTDTSGNNTDATDNNTANFDVASNATAEGVVQLDKDQSRLLQTGGFTVDFSSQKFFQKLIQLVIFETEELSDKGELPEGFVQISKALVITNDAEEEELVTEIKYKREPGQGGGISGGGGSTVGGGGGSSGSSGGGSSSGGGGVNVRATFEFEFVDASGQVQKETVAITVEGGAVPTTSFPTFQPSHSPTDLPSISPTNVFSGQPTTFPSARPTNMPTGTPSIAPSGVPSSVPSEAPSPAPSILNSDTPTLSPSMEPSSMPSMVPSARPSRSPSSIPSLVPSEVPSVVPSFVPSEIPSFVPSFVPSEVPSMQPSMVPSANPSAAPSESPSSQPSSTINLIVPGFPGSQSTTHSAGYEAFRGYDGNFASITHTALQNDPWWQVHIGAGWGNRPCTVKTVIVWNRRDCCPERLYGAYVQLIALNGNLIQQQQITNSIGFGSQTLNFGAVPNVYFIRIHIYGAARILTIAEMQATGYVL
ncbi:unnamed protein product [Cylindrotheca closterium]|uniref:Circumsporozoite protein n=1 Tax=Cylindrotheca closterium TaxID=2856 RepID=A0AAD2G894_9STRA|nr:unnamed protein product [Cylindrotheca closterium]